MFTTDIHVYNHDMCVGLSETHFLQYRLRVSDINHMMTKHIYYTLLTQHIINGMVERNTLMISSLPLIECVRDLSSITFQKR